MTKTVNRWRPTDAICIRDKKSDAVAYLYTSPSGRPSAVAYAGKRSKPDLHLSYSTAARRETSIRTYFEGIQAYAAQKAKLAADRAKPHKLEVGHVLVSSWGYDQTNVDFYQVVRVVGPRTVDVRKIGAISAGDTAYLAGRCIPAVDQFGKAEAFRVRVTDNRIKVGHHYARLWDGRPCYWSAYA